MKETYRCEYVRCGKATCRSCPHGPYWYAYWKEGKRTRKRYVGKVDPSTTAGDTTAEADAPPQTPAPPDWREAMFNDRRANSDLARRILGLGPNAARADAYHAFKELSKRHHPDRGGDAREMTYVNAAWSFLKAQNGW